VIKLVANPVKSLRQNRPDNVDVELIKRPPELRQSTGCVLLRSMGGAENAMLVAVERDRLAPLLQVSLRRVQIVEGVLRAGKAQMQQLAGGIVDIDEQGAFGTAILKPPVMRPGGVDAPPAASNVPKCGCA
jgi:hypothetical protein